MQAAWNDINEEIIANYPEHPDDFNARDFDKPETDDNIEYAIQGDYGNGWETVTYEDGLWAAMRMVNDYRENNPNVLYRMIPWNGEL